jgi:hypothetical protein
MASFAAEQARKAYAIADMANRLRAAQIALVLVRHRQVAGLAGVNDVPPLHPWLAACTLCHRAVETPHHQHGPWRAQQTDFRCGQAHAACQHHAKVFVHSQVWRLRVACVGLENVGGGQARPVYKEKAPPFL